MSVFSSSLWHIVEIQTVYMLFSGLFLPRTTRVSWKKIGEMPNLCLTHVRAAWLTHESMTVWPLMLWFFREVIHGCTCTYWQWTYAVVAGKDTDVCCVLTSGINNLFWNNNVEKKKRCQSAADTVWQAGWSLGSAVEKLHGADRSSVHLLPRQLTSGSRTFVWSQFK